MAFILLRNGLVDRVNLEIECLKFAFAFALFLFDKIHIVTTFETAVLH